MIEFERITLYEEVWTTPLTQLSKKYGLSDNGIRKVCKAMNIPLPTAGHWAKVAAGKAPPRAPLPARADRTTFVSHPSPSASDYRLPQDAAWLADRICFEHQPGNKISIQRHPGRWHMAITALRDEARKALAEIEKLKRNAARAGKGQSRLRTRSLSQDEWRWNFVRDRGEVLFETHRPIPLRVTPRTCERALAILNALCWAASDRGFIAALNDSGRISFTGHDARIQLRMSEQLSEDWRLEPSRAGREQTRVKFKVPTGKLRLYLTGASYSEVQVSDDPDKPLEHKLNFVFERVYRQVVRSWEEARRQAEQERQWEEERKRREAQEARAREIARLEAEERSRQEALIAEAGAWRTASNIRSYIEHVMDAAGPDAGTLRTWRSWALRVAERLDPTSHRANDRNAGNTDSKQF